MSTKGINFTRVFVYGSLKKGYGNHGLILKDSNNEFLGDFVLRGSYTMHDLGSFPGVIDRDYIEAFEPQEIHGEVYKITGETLGALDWLEGNGSFYTRVKIPTTHGKAWIYLLPHDAFFPAQNRITDGKWVPTRRNAY